MCGLQCPDASYSADEWRRLIVLTQVGAALSLVAMLFLFFSCISLPLPMLSCPFPSSQSSWLTNRYGDKYKEEVSVHDAHERVCSNKSLCSELPAWRAPPWAWCMVPRQGHQCQHAKQLMVCRPRLALVHSFVFVCWLFFVFVLVLKLYRVLFYFLWTGTRCMVCCTLVYYVLCYCNL